MTHFFRLLGYKEYEEIGSMPRVDADAKFKPDKDNMGKSDGKEVLKDSADEESSGSESEEEGEDVKKKPVKDKVGFRDRKVIRTFI